MWIYICFSLNKGKPFFLLLYLLILPKAMWTVFVPSRSVGVAGFTMWNIIAGKNGNKTDSMSSEKSVKQLDICESRKIICPLYCLCKTGCKDHYHQG